MFSFFSPFYFIYKNDIAYAISFFVALLPLAGSDNSPPPTDQSENEKVTSNVPASSAVSSAREISAIS